MAKKKFNFGNWFFVVVFILGTFINILYLFYSNPKDCTSCIHAASSDDSISVIDKKIFFWENFLIANQTYTPGLIRLSTLYIKKDNHTKAQEILTKVLFISPNNQEAKSMLKATITN